MTSMDNTWEHSNLERSFLEELVDFLCVCAETAMVWDAVPMSNSNSNLRMTSATLSNISRLVRTFRCQAAV